MTLTDRIKKLAKKNGEIEIEEINLNDSYISVLLPYESACHCVEIEGNTDEEILESFKRGVNKRLNEMCNHLEDCMFDDV